MKIVVGAALLLISAASVAAPVLGEPAVCVPEASWSLDQLQVMLSASLQPMAIAFCFAVIIQMVRKFGG